jgi:type I restriction enzyme S subunit
MVLADAACIHCIRKSTLAEVKREYGRSPNEATRADRTFKLTIVKDWNIKGEWKEATLGDFVALQRGHDLTEADRRIGRVPVLGSAGPNGFHDTALAKGPGIVVGRSGASFGKVHYSTVDFWPHNTALYVTNFRGNDERFAYYFLKSLDFDRYNSGSAQASLNRNFIYPIPVRIPPPAEQKAIAAILGTLDDKIELNRRMNATLEAMARTLFQSWFVDFDPVRANLDGRQPTGLAAAAAALFPNEFEESEIGHIPKGWQVMKVSEFIERLPVGQKYEQKTVSPVGEVPVLDQGKSGVIGFHNDEPGVTATLDKPVAVFANHTCYMRLITYSFSAIQNVLPFVGSGVDTFWAYYATEGRLSFSEYKGHWPDFVIQESAVPPRELTHAFGRLAKPLVAQIRNNEEESRILATLRDTLLPKLLSGDCRIAATLR